jgi:hypothetical protein
MWTHRRIGCSIEEASTEARSIKNRRSEVHQSPMAFGINGASSTGITIEHPWTTSLDNRAGPCFYYRSEPRSQDRSKSRTEAWKHRTEVWKHRRNEHPSEAVRVGRNILFGSLPNAVWSSRFACSNRVAFRAAAKSSSVLGASGLTPYGYRVDPLWLSKADSKRRSID